MRFVQVINDAAEPLVHCVLQGQTYVVVEVPCPEGVSCLRHEERALAVFRDAKPNPAKDWMFLGPDGARASRFAVRRVDILWWDRHFRDLHFRDLHFSKKTTPKKSADELAEGEYVCDLCYDSGCSECDTPQLIGHPD